MKGIFQAAIPLFCLIILSQMGYSAANAWTKYDRIIQSISVTEGIRASLIHALIKAESNYNPFAVSHKGAVGLMQLMPETAREYSVSNVYDPYENIEAGVRHFKKLLQKNNGNVQLALAAYNAGQSAVDKYGGIPPYPETRSFVKKVNSYELKRTNKAGKKIFTFYDDSGRLVITNIPHLQKSRLR